MHQTLLAAAISPDNTPHGYNLTFAFPMLMFIIIAAALYLRFRGSHRVPGHVALASTRWATPGQSGTAARPQTHSETVATQPVAAAVEQADPGPASVAHGATLDAEATRTTSGSSLHEGTDEAGAVQAEPGQASTGQASTAQESTEDSE